MNPKKMLCIFAHPDDESFGPSGTIAKYAHEGCQVYIICATDGNDINNGQHKNLVKKRTGELKLAAKILGVKQVFFLNYKDGDLRNNIYHEVAKKIEKIINKIKPSILLTYELRGVSGHIDHVFCSLVSSYIFRETYFIKKILYYCIPRIWAKLEKNYFIYFPPGYSKHDVDLVENVSEYWDLKIQAIKAHESQKIDGDQILKLFKIQRLLSLSKEEYFLVRKK